ncbi:hypothetical protein ACQRXC_28690 (plasmid) [Niallia taxi]|uniref:hypothetical protein n=1 Tax=Niallia TaxID=2837506 RepID=UPI0015F4531F|nr:hypothetical protein [Niallia taxi]MED4057165.1 hypothetical protein [Niallia taxi]MED4122147.1 hypothetical protein [Niallia taxi]
MIKKIQSIVENIFTTADQKRLILKTSEKHNDAKNILNRTLNEVSLFYRIENFYSFEEKNNDKGDLIEYIFSEYIGENIDLLNKSFRKNEGTLFLVDEEIKKKINKKFRYKKLSHISLRNESTINQCPDFIYEVAGNSIWVNLKEIRTSEEEEEHTNNLEILYKSLFQTKEITIDINFEQYNITTSEKTYSLNHFRLERNSFHLVLEDRDTKQLITHTFEKMQSIAYQHNDKNMKFWLYMDEGTYRFFIPINNDKLNNIPIDPIIYKIF